MNGVLNVLKPVGITSFDVIRQVRKTSDQRKIGHLGTLDPIAGGVLPLFLGKMTKLIPHFNLSDKSYRVEARFGASSTTLDAEGELTPVAIPHSSTPELIERTLLRFLGEGEQLPPMYSAVKVRGKKLYEYARKGEAVERKPRRIEIHSISNIDCRLPVLTFDISCSKGTYIRTLVNDLGEKMGCGAYLSGLMRTKCGPYFTLENAVPLEQIKNINKTDLQKYFIQPEWLFTEWHAISVQSTETVQQLCHGQPIEVTPAMHRPPLRGGRFPKAMVKDLQDRVIAIGRLEFSQDGRGRFFPSNILI